MSHRGGPDHDDVTSSWFGVWPCWCCCAGCGGWPVWASAGAARVHVPSAPLR